MSKPTYVYKILSASDAPPDPIPDALPLSNLDSASGFIHLSTAKQIPGTLEHFFVNQSSVYIARLKYDDVEKDIRWEDPKAEVCGERGGEGMFPHLYNGGRLGKAEIESVVAWTKRSAGWDDVLKQAESWLIY
ncbi:hypothetical protein BD779DRAFT_1490632 [Infundibulicybe gibba]|nr:hypothetical protein BD779DRAFT_1490632 [Infundibulicybe gibba]